VRLCRSEEILIEPVNLWDCVLREHLDGWRSDRFLPVDTVGFDSE